MLKAYIHFSNPTKTLNGVKINTNKPLDSIINFTRVVVEIINNKLTFREALSMDDNLTISKSSWGKSITFHHKKAKNFIGTWEVIQKGDLFILETNLGEEELEPTT